MNALLFDISIAQNLLESKNSFPVDFNDLWQWCGYSRKDVAKEMLTRNFEKGFDYVLEFPGESRKTSLGGRPSESIYLTINAAKEFGMISQTEKGREVRKYFIEAEKVARQLTQKPIDRPIWLKRLTLNPASNIPKGYFSIFNETVIIMARYEEKGFIFPDNMIPDISVGKCWVNYLNANHIEYDRKQYKHNAPNPHIKSVDAWCYNLDLLGVFRKWYDAEYEPVKLLPYMSKNKLITPEIASKMLDLPLLS